MAATGSVVYARPRLSAGASGSTGSVVFFAARASTGIYSSSVIDRANTRNRKVIRPVNVPIAEPKTGMINQQWEQYFVYIESQFLNMLHGPTLPDLSRFITQDRAIAFINEAVQQGLAAQANANAQSINTIREVVQTAALPGAMQIPAPRLYSDFTPEIPRFESAGGGE